MKQKNKRALSVQIPEIIIQDDDTFFDYSFYFALHNSHTGGVTKNLKSKYCEIASRLNIHPNTVRKYIGRICARGWAWRSQGNLHTLSQGKLKEQFGLENKRCKKFSIRSTDFKEVQKAIRVKIIETNLTRQAHRVKQKEYSKLAKKMFGKLIAVTPSMDKAVRKSLKYFSANNIKLLKESNYDYTLSKRKIAQLLNRKSAMTGSNFIRKAPEYFSVQKRTSVLESGVNRRFFDEYRKVYKGGNFLFYFNGRIFERKSDLISFKSYNKKIN